MLGEGTTGGIESLRGHLHMQIRVDLESKCLGIDDDLGHELTTIEEGCHSSTYGGLCFTDHAGDHGGRTSTVVRQDPDYGGVQWVEIVCGPSRMFSTSLWSEGLTFLEAQVIGDPFGGVAEDMDHRLGVDAQYRR